MENSLEKQRAKLKMLSGEVVEQFDNYELHKFQNGIYLARNNFEYYKLPDNFVYEIKNSTFYSLRKYLSGIIPFVSTRERANFVSNLVFTSNKYEPTLYQYNTEYKYISSLKCTTLVVDGLYGSNIDHTNKFNSVFGTMQHVIKSDGTIEINYIIINKYGKQLKFNVTKLLDVISDLFEHRYGLSEKKIHDKMQVDFRLIPVINDASPYGNIVRVDVQTNLVLFGLYEVYTMLEINMDNMYVVENSIASVTNKFNKGGVKWFKTIIKK